MNGIVPAGSSTNTVQLVGASTRDDAYNGTYIWLKTNVQDPNTATPSPFVQFNEIRIISDYDGATQTATVSLPFTADLSAIADPFSYAWDILTFTEDSYYPLINIGTDTYSQSVCYELTIQSLTLPNKTLLSGQGNRIAFYPYVYVEILGDDTSVGTNVIASNNPNSVRSMFKVPIYNVNSPDRASFVVLNGQGMRQTVKFNPFRGFRFRVLLPDGDFILVENDNQPPLLPNPDVQVSMVLAFRRM
jgi:hypothetical protein